LFPKEKAGAAGSEATLLAANAGAESVFVVLLLLGVVPANITLLFENSGDSGELPSA
jgi:hypothetical protein